MKPASGLPFVAALWLVLTVAAIAGRPALPVDETRALSVAWEMWTRGDFLVPYLNGSPYSHKPPLLQWLIVLGWKIGGVGEAWARIVGPLFGLGCLWLTHNLASRLWPQRASIAAVAPIFLIGMPFWAVFSTATLYDMLFTFFVLLGIIGLAHAWRSGLASGFVIFGVATGLGILSKGPAVLVHLGIPALLAPLWITVDRPRWRQWYLGVLGGVLIGLAIASSWAFPAAFSGGEDYARGILWHQTADRMASSFAHQRPFWWYLPLVPLLLFPWTAWPSFWRALNCLRSTPFDSGTRLALLGSGGGLAALSMISGKQPHYLLPLFSAVVLIAARVIDGAPLADARHGWLPGLMILVSATVLAWLRTAAPALGLPDFVAQIPALTVLGVGCVGAVMMVTGFAILRREVERIAVGLVAIVAALQCSPVLGIWGNYDLRPAALRLKEAEARGIPIAHVGTYHGQFQFLGRLTTPLAVLSEGQIAAWFEEHPDGRAVVYTTKTDRDIGNEEFSQPFRTQGLAIVKRTDNSPARVVAVPASRK